MTKTENTHVFTLVASQSCRSWYEKRQIRLKHFVVNLLVKIVRLYMLNICL